MPSISDFSCVAFHQLTARQLYDILVLRAQVFVVEQHCSYLDPDGIDRHDDVFHLSAHDVEDRLALYARLIGPATTHAVCGLREASIGRVVCAGHLRGQGLGNLLMQQALIQCAALWPGVPLRLSAQAHLQAFYRGHGFESSGAPYLEDGIPHILMRHPG